MNLAALLFAASLYFAAANNNSVWVLRLKSADCLTLGISELEVFDTSNSPLAPSRVSLSDEQSGYPAANCMDGSTSTECISDTSGPLEVEFPGSLSASDFARIVVTGRQCCFNRLVKGTVSLEQVNGQGVVWRGSFEEDARVHEFRPWDRGALASYPGTSYPSSGLVLRVFSRACANMGLSEVTVYGWDGAPIAPAATVLVSKYTFGAADYGGDKCTDGVLGTECASWGDITVTPNVWGRGPLRLNFDAPLTLKDIASIVIQTRACCPDRMEDGTVELEDVAAAKIVWVGIFEGVQLSHTWTSPTTSTTSSTTQSSSSTSSSSATTSSSSTLSTSTSTSTSKTSSTSSSSSSTTSSSTSATTTSSSSTSSSSSTTTSTSTSSSSSSSTSSSTSSSSTSSTSSSSTSNSTSSSSTSSTSSSSTSRTTSSSSTSSTSSSSTSRTTSSSSTSSTSSSVTSSTSTSATLTSTSSTSTSSSSTSRTSSSTSSTSLTSTSTSVTTTNTAAPLFCRLASRLASGSLDAAQAEELQSAARASWRSLGAQLGGAGSAALELEKGCHVEVVKVAGRQRLTLQSGLAVSLPPPLLANLSTDAALAVATLPLPAGGAMKAVQAMELLPHFSDEEKLEVSGLAEPIVFSLPVNFSARLGCAYFDEAAGALSRQGVAAGTQPTDDGLLSCETSHLSLFAALLQGAVRTLECSNFGLFSAEAFAQLGEGTWARGPGAAMCWSLLAALVLLFVGAASRDGRYAALWSSEFLLIPTGPTDAEESADEGPGGGALCAKLRQWCTESSALREALDDIVGNFFQQFAELRTLLESLCEALEVDTATAGNRGRLLALVHKVMAHSVKVNARRVAGARLNLSDGTFSFLLDDETLQDYLESAYERRAAEAGEFRAQATEVEREGKALDHSGLACRLAAQRGDFAEKQRCLWLHMHHGVCQAVVAHTHHYLGYSTFWVVLWIFLQSNPVNAALQLDIFTSCKERVLLLAADTLGALALSCVFFEAGGMATRRGSFTGDSGGCGEEEAYGDLAQEVGATAGRFLVVATGSYLLAGVPVLILNGLLGSSGVEKLDAHGSRGWRKQLRARALQRGLFWGAGSGYCCLCFLYVLVFLANVDDDSDWAFAGLLALLQDLFVFPLIISLIIPALVALALAVHGKFGDKQALRKQLRTSLVARGSVSLAVPDVQHPRQTDEAVGYFGSVTI